MSDGKLDKAALIAQIKKRLAEGPDADAAAGSGTDGGASEAAAGQEGGGEPDMAARIAALKAKMDAGKAAAAEAPTAVAQQPKPAAKPRKTGGAKNIFPVEPVSKRVFGDDRFYRPNTLNLWFIISSLLLTISVLLMWQRDHVRDWKSYQREARLVSIQRRRPSTRSWPSWPTSRRKSNRRLPKSMRWRGANSN